MISNIKIVKGLIKVKLFDKNNIKNIKKEFILEGFGCVNCVNKME